MKWLDLAACFTGAMLAYMYFAEDKFLLAILWLLIAIIDGVLFVVRDNDLFMR